MRRAGEWMKEEGRWTKEIEGEKIRR